jgi:hypothetical protein
MGGDTVHIPKISASFAATAIPATSGAITPTNVSDTNSTLTVDQWMGVRYDISDLQWAQVMKSAAIKSRYAQAMGEALARKLDTAILANGSSVTAVVGNSATKVLATSLEKAMGILTSNSVPLADSIWLFHPKTYFNEVLGNNQKLYDASQFGKAVLPTGVIDMLYGVPVVISENVPVGTAGTEGASGHRNLLVHRRAIAYATGALEGAGAGGIRLQEKPSENQKTVVVADIAYGTVIVDAAAGVRVLSKS